MKQFAEFTISQGLKPTLTGETIPLNVDNSTLIRGADKPSYFYINAISLINLGLIKTSLIAGTVYTQSAA